ncbi:MAG TPA: ANTAR domain-containing protein [Gammaproteobacteria bacterium]|nr:ANTAR domain-containing protein [Gammaproteobacteria bacterium]
MSMKLRVMLVDDRDERVELLKVPLMAAGHEIVARVHPDDDLQARVQEWKPDVIIVDMDSPSRDTLEQMRCITRDQPRPIVMFAESHDRNLIQDAVQAGVSAYIVDGLGHKRVIPILEVAIARFNEFQNLRRELEETRLSLAERRTLDRAKALLMEQRGWTEKQAYQALRKMAMDRNLRMGQVAEQLVAMFELMGLEPRT